MTTVRVRRHKRQKPKPPNRDLQKIVELELPTRRRAAMMQGTRDSDAKLKAAKRVQLDADITRLKGNLASVPQPYDSYIKNAISQMQQDLNELARK